MTFTDAVIVQFFRTINLPARTGTSHTSSVLTNCYQRNDLIKKKQVFQSKTNILEFHDCKYVHDHCKVLLTPKVH